MEKIFTREARKYFYAIVVALGPLVSFYGLATQEEIALWLGLGATILGIPAGGTALANLTPEEITSGAYEEYEEVEDLQEVEYTPQHADEHQEEENGEV